MDAILDLPDSDGGTRLAKTEKQVNGQSITSLEVILGSGTTFTLTPQMGILDMVTTADTFSIEAADPLGRSRIC